MDPFEKEECKIIISEYLNSDREKKINAKNANQLYFIIDFLIEYINNKEKNYLEKNSDSNPDLNSKQSIYNTNQIEEEKNLLKNLDDKQKIFDENNTLKHQSNQDSNKTKLKSLSKKPSENPKYNNI